MNKNILGAIIVLGLLVCMCLMMYRLNKLEKQNESFKDVVDTLNQYKKQYKNDIDYLEEIIHEYELNKYEEYSTYEEKINSSDNFATHCPSCNCFD
jgi:predicted CopG family antitoxin